MHGNLALISTVFESELFHVLQNSLSFLKFWLFLHKFDLLFFKFSDFGDQFIFAVEIIDTFSGDKKIIEIY